MPTPTGACTLRVAAPGCDDPADLQLAGFDPHAGSGGSNPSGRTERRARARLRRRSDGGRAGVIATLLLVTIVAVAASTHRILAARGIRAAAHAQVASTGGGSPFVPAGRHGAGTRPKGSRQAGHGHGGKSAAGVPIGGRMGSASPRPGAAGGRDRRLETAAAGGTSVATTTTVASGAREMTASRPGAALAAARARLSGGPPPAPAREVDRWTVRMAVDDRAGTVAALERMRHYEPLVRAALARHGLPAELVALPVVESSYLHGATSRVGAAGIWQLMPATARALGLEVSEHVDERRDPVRSTEAAARHLADLHGRFGSWHLVLAAYNAGGGRVGGAMGDRAARGDDLLYWLARERLPAETREYVPKLLAAARVAGDPGAYGLSVPVAEPLAFRRVRVPAATALDEVARRTGYPVEEIHRLNPHLVRRRTPPDRAWPVRIPLLPGAAPE